ncbi:hypothetical protein [Sphingomonas sp. G-3-2-10]|uniref:hypothetical protein n=1 Tax=Sphingomonas sp. G-3-2-10 TaxID=2728838 RepID=UPI001469B4D5|nr:hypothetical protein [Sphingomonas sp. G-3-2-10]NML04650.1 hypothetical protein [Sphingomonas sp. G-3-2-10]
MEWLGVIGIGAAVLLASAALSWMLQRRMRWLHPVGTAVLAIVLMLAILVLIVGWTIVQTLARIGEAGTGTVSDAVPAVDMLHYGVLQGMLILAVGFPIALIVAFRTRGRKGGR